MSEQNPKPIISELPEYYEWYQQEKIDFMTYASNKLTPDLAITVTRLFYPEFILYDEGIFLANLFSKNNYHEWKSKLNCDLSAIEKVMNHIHLAQDLLIYPFENLSYQNIAYFGNILVKTWSLALKDQYPQRVFKVVGGKDGDFDDFVITFWQES